MKASGDGAIFHQYLQIHIRTTFIHPKTGRKQQKPFHLSISKFENTSDLLIEIHPPKKLRGKGVVSISRERSGRYTNLAAAR